MSDPRESYRDRDFFINREARKMISIAVSFTAAMVVIYMAIAIFSAAPTLIRVWGELASFVVNGIVSSLKAMTIEDKIFTTLLIVCFFIYAKWKKGQNIKNYGVKHYPAPPESYKSRQFHP